MIQYLNLLKEIKEKGTWKDAAREGMPRTLSRFGEQLRFDLSEGFPILTTKKLSFKNIVTELLWFLRGDTNIKYLVDNGCNIWNEDAYNYYLKKSKKEINYNILSFERFINLVKTQGNEKEFRSDSTYKLGDCGKQYGWLWRHWEKFEEEMFTSGYQSVKVDQIKELIEGLKKNPMSRRHIITAWNPATLDDMALNACHVLSQFNCRPYKITLEDIAEEGYDTSNNDWCNSIDEIYEKVTERKGKYFLDCQMYQRSADVFLG